MRDPACRWFIVKKASYVKRTLMQIWKSANIIFSIWNKFVEDFTLKHPLLFNIYAWEICQKFVYKDSETIEYVKN